MSQKEEHIEIHVGGKEVMERVPNHSNRKFQNAQEFVLA